MQKIGDRSQVILTDNKAIVLVRNPTLAMIICSVFFIFSLALFFNGFLILFDLGVIPGIAIMLVSVGLFLFTLHVLGEKEVSEIDLEQNTCLCKSLFFGLCQETVFFKFPTEYTLWGKKIYGEEDIVYPATIYLVVSDVTKEQSDQEIIHFQNVDAFLNFQRLFNEKFPVHKIR
jgi:hypothetical protein